MLHQCLQQRPFGGLELGLINVPPVAFVQAQGVGGAELGHTVQLPSQSSELGIVVQLHTGGQVRFVAPALGDLRVAEVELKAHRVDRAQIGAYRHRWLTALDAVQRHPRHARRFGNHGRTDLQVLAMGTNTLAQCKQSGCQQVTDRGRFGRQLFLILFKFMHLHKMRNIIPAFRRLSWAELYFNCYTLSSMSRSATLPPIRVTPETKASIDAALRKGESLTQFIENAVCREAEFRAEQNAALVRAERALAAADQGIGLMTTDDFLADMHQRAQTAQHRIRAAVVAGKNKLGA